MLAILGGLLFLVGLLGAAFENMFLWVMIAGMLLMMTDMRKK